VREAVVIPDNFGVALPEHVSPPHGRAAVYALAGFQQERDVRADGTFDPQFEAREIVRVATPLPLVYAGVKVTRVAVHRRVVRWLGPALEEVAEARLWDLLLRYGGGFNPRLVRGGGGWSMHSFGFALDFDPDANPLGAPPEECRIGGTVEGRVVVDIFTRWGFLWGGHFDGRKDCQHFQWCTGC